MPWPHDADAHGSYIHGFPRQSVVVGVPLVRNETAQVSIATNIIDLVGEINVCIYYVQTDTRGNLIGSECRTNARDIRIELLPFPFLMAIVALGKLCAVFVPDACLDIFPGGGRVKGLIVLEGLYVNSDTKLPLWPDSHL